MTVKAATKTIVYANPAHQQHMLKAMTGVHWATIKVGGRIFGLIASVVNDNAGQRSLAISVSTLKVAATPAFWASWG
jgi:hypothetical protein